MWASVVAAYSRRLMIGCCWAMKDAMILGLWRRGVQSGASDKAWSLTNFLCNKVLLKYKRDRESFWLRHQKGAERLPPCQSLARCYIPIFSWMLYTYTSPVAQMVKHLPTMQETWVLSLGWDYLLEKEMATHSSTPAWKIPWIEEPGRLQSKGLQRVGHDWATSLQLHFNFKSIVKVDVIIVFKD